MISSQPIIFAKTIYSPCLRLCARQSRNQTETLSTQTPRTQGAADLFYHGWTRIRARRKGKRRRRGIFVETQPGMNKAPSGAAYSGHCPDDVAPDGAWSILHWRFYKYASPTGFGFETDSCRFVKSVSKFAFISRLCVLASLR